MMPRKTDPTAAYRLSHPSCATCARNDNTSEEDNVVSLFERFITEDECRRMTTLSRSRRMEMARYGKFPKKVKLTDRRSAWLLSDILRWIDLRKKGLDWSEAA